VLATGPVLLLEQRRPVAFDLASVLARGLSGDVRFASLSTDGGRFEDLALNFSAKPGRIDAELQNLRLQLPTAATEGLNLRGRLSLRPLPKSGPAILESLDLDAGPLALAADHGSPIRLGQVHLRGEQLSLPQAGARPGWKMLAQVLAGAPAALQIEARDLDYRGRHLDAMRLELSGAEPGFNVRLPETRFGETRAQGDGWADPTQPELPWRLRFKAEQVELAFVHELIQASGAARGRLRVDADLTGTGMHADLWPTRLNGRLLIQ
jgi:hypothetical protein